MKKILFAVLLAPFLSLGQAGGPVCSQMEPICTDVGLNFTANSGVAEASTTDPGNDYDCLITQPNPSWFYLEIATSGTINMNLTANSDIDFIIYGPFASLSAAQAQCGDLGAPAAEIIDCSFSPTNNEFPSIPSAVAGQVYVMLITNYADVVQDITLQQVSGAGSTDCSIVTAPPCAMTALNVNVGGCEFATGTYDVAGSIEFTDPPLSGNLVVVGCSGVPQIVASAPFPPSPISFTILNQVANGLPCTITASFTGDPTCTQSYNYIAPVCIPNCPTYDLQSFSPAETCGNQMYALEIQNSGCDGYVEFNVVGNYGSSYASEITWQVTSNLTGNVVASGGPGTNGANFNVSTGQLNPAVQGYVYTLQLSDSYGDGFNGSGGYITIQANGSNIITPITGNFGFGQTLMFQAPLIVSTSTMTVQTPSGPISSVMGNCNDHSVYFNLANTNFCTPIQVDLPWTITCDNSGTLIASGTHTVIVYPQVPTQSSDLVSVTWNTTTCSWDVSTNNDCSDLDIGTIFNISPDPASLSNYCANGNQSFSVEYLGLAGSPNCCSTAGPTTNITYSNSANVVSAATVTSPFGGAANNSAYITFPANGSGGNATSLSLNVNLSGFCVNPPGIGGSTTFWVTIFVDGFIIYDQQHAGTTFNQTFTLANLPYGYNENSVVQIYVYPNALGSVWDRNDPCPVNDAEWNLSTFNASLNVTFEQLIGTPVNCTLAASSPYTCCITAPITTNPIAPITVQCDADAPVNIALVTGIVSECSYTVTHQGDVMSGTCPKTITRTYRVTDNCGNFLEVIHTITVDDTQPPVFSAPPASTTVQCVGDIPAPVSLGWTDNCLGSGSVMSTDGPLVGDACGGSITRTWTFADDCGNSSTVTQVFTVDDTTPPVASNPAPSSATAGSVPAPDPAVVIGETDNCSIPTVTFVNQVITGACPEIYTREYLVEDACGNQTTVYHVISVGDAIAPTADLIPDNNSFECAADIPVPNISIVTGVSDNGAPPVVTYVDDVSDGGTCPEIITRRYQVTDDCGNFIYVTQNFILTDITDPSIAAAPGPVTVNCIADLPVNISLNWTDNCTGSGSVMGVDATNGASCPETITRTWSYADDCGNTATVSQLITVIPVINPTEVGGPVAVSSTVECAADAIVPTLPVIEDACGNILSPLAGSPIIGGTYAGCEGTITYTYNYEDCAGNPFSWTYTYTIDIVTSPAELGGPIATTSTVECAADAVAPLLPVIEDVCGNVLTPSAPTMGGTYVDCEGTITYTYDYLDCSGLPFSWTYTYNIVLTSSPSELGGPVATTSTVECIADAVSPATMPVIQDACGNILLPIGPAVTGGTYTGCEGTYTYTYQYEDCAGSPFEWVYNYIIDITTMPTEVGGPISNSSVVNCASAAVAPVLPVIEDVCGNILSPLLSSPALGGTYVDCEGTITYTYDYKDCAGNDFIWVYTYTIDLTAAPTEIGGPVATNSTVDCAADAVVPILPVIEDACGNTLTPLAGSPVMSGTYVACEGTIIYTYNYQDCAGNPFAWAYTYTVDVPAFTIGTANGASTVDCVADAQVQPIAPVVTDACGNTLTPVVSTPSAVVCEGTMVWTFTYTDCASNTADWTYTYTIDVPAFTIGTANGASTVNCVADGQVQPTAPVVTDACGNTLTPVVSTPSAVACEGAMVWTFTYMDCANNTADWTYTYTIDVPAFTIGTANGSSTVSCVADAQVQPTAPVVTDACGNTLTPVVSTPSAIACEGTMVWTYTYTDCASNTADWTYTYTIDQPVFSVSFPDGSATVSCPADAVDPGSPGVVTDACGNTLTPVVTAPSAVGCSGGTMDWLYTYTDCAGNSDVWTFSYTVSMAPFSIAAADGSSTVNCAADALVQPAGPGVINDQCGNAITPVITAPTAIACEGTMTWIFTYTDCASNSDVWTYTYTIDVPAFTIGTANGASTVDCVADAQVQPTAPTVTDACGNTLTPVVTAPSVVACEGDMVWTFTYTDCASNTVDWTYTYTIDVPAFTIGTANGASTVNCVADAQVQPIAPVVTDACGNTLTPVVSTPSAVVCEGTMVWTFTYTDCASNTADWTYTYTIDQPLFTIGTANGSSTVSCVADAQVQPIAPVVTDACGNTLAPVVSSPSAIACEGDMVWIYTYTDCASNTADWTYTYTIDQPTFSVSFADGSATVSCPADAVDPGNPGVVTDACGNTLNPVVTAPSAVGCSGGTMDWLYTYTDCAGNSDVWTFSYTVSMAPFSIAAADGSSTVNCAADALVQPAGPGVINDQCGNAITPVITAPTAIACEGTMTWIFTYTDCASNSDVWTYTYTIDVPAFTIGTANGASTVDCVADAQVQPTAPTVTDACGNTLTPVVTSPSVIACEGDMVWTFTYTDCASNTADWTYTFTIDVPAFTIGTANGASAVNCVADAQVQPTAPAVTDACGNTLIPVVTTPSAVACEGDMVWTFTYTDCASNTADWTYTYTIDVPAFTLSYANGSGIVACPADAVDPGSPGVVTDACGNTLTPVVTAPSAVGCSGGTMDWVYTYTDCAGNSLDWVFSYTVDMPAFALPLADDGSTVTCLSNAQIQPSAPAVVYDQCGNEIVPVVTTPADIMCEGTMEWIYTYTDCAGNSDVWIYTYTIDFNTTLTAPLNGSAFVQCAGDAVDPGAPASVTDACGNTVSAVLNSVVTTPDPLICSGTIVYTYRYSACDGSFVDWTYTYTVNDDVAPTGTAPADVTVGSSSEIPVADITSLSNVTDNCTVNPTVVWVSDVSDGVDCPETITRTYSITDDCGNSISVSQTIIVDGNCEIVIPTAFTPNGDLENDEWDIIYLDEVYPNNLVMVYNRWGNLIFESNKGAYTTNKWDGTYNTELLPVGSYYYMILTEGDNSGEILKGTVSIIIK
jgi:gliding motility-associated-like protein